MKKHSQQAINPQIQLKNLNIGSYIILVISLTLILFLTLFPFRFEQFDRIWQIHHHFSGFEYGGYSRCCTHLAFYEPLANVLLFMPFGFGLASLFNKKPVRRSFVIALIASLGLSLTIEFLQVFQPERSPSLTDVLTNSTGGILGFLCFKATYKLYTVITRRFRR